MRVYKDSLIAVGQNGQVLTWALSQEDGSVVGGPWAFTPQITQKKDGSSYRIAAIDTIEI